MALTPFGVLEVPSFFRVMLVNGVRSTCVTFSCHGDRVHIPDGEAEVSTSVISDAASEVTGVFVLVEVVEEDIV